MKRIAFYIAFLFILIFTESCNNPSPPPSANVNNSDSVQLKEENISYSADTAQMNGYIVYNNSNTQKRPGILVVHEWWGLTEYPKFRARELAKLGYIAMAVDMYGNGRTASDPGAAQALAAPFYKDPALVKTRLDAAITKLKTYAQVDTSNIAAIGYCYGGYVVLNAAKLGTPLKGVVSFHGDLSGVVPDKDLLKSKILVCHGADDKFVNADAVNKFKKQMDSVHANYTFTSYPNAVHSFTNPKSTETGLKFKIPIAYNAEADKNSWNDMRSFFEKLFK